LPSNAKRNLRDPMKNNSNKVLIAAFGLAILLGIGAMGGWLWHKGYLEHYIELQKQEKNQDNTTNDK
ncbi:hypothetical protein, partial [Gilliamella sp. Fer4-1]